MVGAWCRYVHTHSTTSQNGKWMCPRGRFPKRFVYPTYMSAHTAILYVFLDLYLYWVR